VYWLVTVQSNKKTHGTRVIIIWYKYCVPD